MRYRCSNKDCRRTINAHDVRLINQLPLDLQMEFPALLTHRGGISNTLVDLLRPCMQNSVGPSRFKKIASELHHLRHDKLELQYLLSNYKKRKGLAGSFLVDPVEPFSVFEDQSQYAGYVPSAAYFRTVYTKIIEKIRPKMDKHMMLLDGKVLKGDHSFKFPKHMANIDGTTMFTALYTMTNK